MVVPFFRGNPFPLLAPAPCPRGRRYGYDWRRIRAELLPTKSPQQLFHRKKNRLKGRDGADNPIKVRELGVTVGGSEGGRIG